MNRILVCGFGNPDNRGCEAIIRTTTEMIRNIFPEAEIIVSSNDYGRVSMLDVPQIDRYVGSYYPHSGTIDSYIYAALHRTFKTAMPLCKIMNKKNYRSIGKIDLCVSVGGDNFCYNDRIEHFIVHHQHFKTKGARLVHFGSSFEERLLSEKLKKDLMLFDAIMVRESISYNSLIAAGIGDKVSFVPDPAFILKSKRPNAELCIECGCVGLNISPMVISKEKHKGIVVNSVSKLINQIIAEGRQVVLIPHVTDKISGSEDYRVMSEILGRVIHPERCCQIGYSYSAEEYKYIISKCEMFIGARTHSTIAAYSTGVPTLVIGYSVKAKGIATDLFGTEENYVLPVQSIATESDLINHYEFLKANKMNIRARLHKIMPAYIEKARTAERVIWNVCAGGC